MARARRTTVITLVLAAVAGTVAAPAAAAPSRRTALPGSSGPLAARTAVVGRSSHWVVYNDLTNHVVRLADPAGRTAPQLLARDARAIAVSGDLVEYRAAGHVRWRRLGTAQAGRVPSGWRLLAPDGWLRVRDLAGVSRLEYRHLDGTTRSLRLPRTKGPVRYSVAAGRFGVAVVARSPGRRPTAVFATPRGRLVRLDTAGLPRGMRLACTSLTRRAVGCLAGHRVVRLSTRPGRAPQQSIVHARPLAVAVTDHYTAWTQSRSRSGRSCPCVLASIDATGTAEAAVSGLTSPALAAGGSRFYYSRGLRPGQAGIRMSKAAGATERLIAPAGRRALRAGAPALAAGRAVWTDDRRGAAALWSAPVRPDASPGTNRLQAVRADLAPVAVSGSRTVYSTRGHVLHVVHGISHRTDRAVARGTLVGLSGPDLLYRGARRHLILLDLVRGVRVDETSAHGARAAALFGRYLSYVRGDGSVWRLDVDRADPAPVRLSGPLGRITGARVSAWGDWTAWTVRAGRSVATAWRNAATLAPARRLGPSRQVVGASAGGLVVARPGAATRYALVGWISGHVRAALPGTAAPVVDGSTVAWLRDGTPTVSRIAVRVRNRPRALGEPEARRRVAPGGTWHLELPTSAALTRCAVTVERRGYHRTLPCARGWQARGDVVAQWRPGSAPAGRYRFTVRAAGTGGSVVPSAGGQGRTSGTVVVRAAR